MTPPFTAVRFGEHEAEGGPDLPPATSVDRQLIPVRHDEAQVFLPLVSWKHLAAEDQPPLEPVHDPFLKVPDIGNIHDAVRVVRGRVVQRGHRVGARLPSSSTA